MNRNVEVGGASPEKLLDAAREASTKAYAPYSHFYVGAAVLSVDGKIYSGCNVENVSYSITSCAERNAIAAAILAEGGEEFQLQAIAVAARDTAASDAVVPCGACRQAIAQFGRNAVVIFCTSEGAIEQRSISELLPVPFSAKIKPADPKPNQNQT